MKRFMLLIVFSCVFLILVAQGLYFEAGGGIGMSTNQYEVGISSTSTDYYSGYGYSYLYSSSESQSGMPYSRSGFGMDFGGKIGYGELLGLPMYLVGEVFWIRSNTWQYKDETTESYSYISGNNQGRETYTYKRNVDLDISHLFFGPGIVYYPTPNFQFATSVGLVNTNVSAKFTDEEVYQEGDWSDNEKLSLTQSESGIGFGLTFSGAVELGNSGLMLGAKYSYLNNQIDFEVYRDKLKLDISSSYVGLFAKYRIKSR